MALLCCSYHSRPYCQHAKSLDCDGEFTRSAALSGSPFVCVAAPPAPPLCLIEPALFCNCAARAANRTWPLAAVTCSCFGSLRCGGTSPRVGGPTGTAIELYFAGPASNRCVSTDTRRSTEDECRTRPCQHWHLHRPDIEACLQFVIVSLTEVLSTTDKKIDGRLGNAVVVAS